jgi:ubiquinone/menaquinone biosynthesis C-methylase UbiE
MIDPVTLQRKYYSETAAAYDGMHVSGIDEHFTALSWLSGLIALHRFESLLDVGSGTGRCLMYLKEQGLTLSLAGVEPVAAMRDIGIRKGLSEAELFEGNALALPFGDKSVDVVCSFGILHHIEDHKRAVSEMCRVARCAVFISDVNNFASGARLARAAKQAIRAAGLWPAVNFIKTKGKRYRYSEGDGVSYSYSLFNDVPLIRRQFPDIRFMSTGPSGADLFRTAPGVALFAQASTAAATAPLHNTLRQLSPQ